MFMSLGEYQKALQDLAWLEKSSSITRELLFKSGLCYYHTHAYPLAIAYFDKVLTFAGSQSTTAILYEIDPKTRGVSGLKSIETVNADIYHYKGLCYHRMDQINPALKQFARALSIQKNPDFYTNRALLWMENGDTAIALLDIDSALAIAPNHSDALYNKAVLTNDLELIYQSEELANSSEGYAMQGLSAFQSGDYEQSLDLYSKAIRLDSGSTNLFINRGVVLMKLKEYQKAAGDFKKSISMINGQLEGHYLLGNAQHNLGAYTNAQSHYDHYLSLVYDNTNAYYNAGINAYQIKDKKKACRYLQASKDLGSNQASITFKKICVP